MPDRQTTSTASPYEERFGFSRAVKIGNTISIAGTAPIGDDGRTVGIGDPAKQARRCLDIIEGCLAEFDASLSDVVRTRLYLTRIDDAEIIGRVHGEYFRAARPVSTLLEVSRLVDPEWLIEIEADAIVDHV
jgi:enamine deaminase RidA (YjgF/YER057c/UK114 family)